MTSPGIGVVPREADMADNPAATRGTLHAELREVEAGVFRAAYHGELNPENPDEREFPDTHVGTDPVSVRTWVEEMAKGMGYARVAWSDTTQSENPAGSRR